MKRRTNIITKYQVYHIAQMSITIIENIARGKNIGGNYHRHHKFIELLIILLCLDVLKKSGSFINRICPFAGSISHVCFCCLCCCLYSISGNERYKQLIPSSLWNLDHAKGNISFNDVTTTRWTTKIRMSSINGRSTLSPLSQQAQDGISKETCTRLKLLKYS